MVVSCGIAHEFVSRTCDLPQHAKHMQVGAMQMKDFETVYCGIGVYNFHEGWKLHDIYNVRYTQQMLTGSDGLPVWLNLEDLASIIFDGSE
jgi:hypothetical protein